MLFTNCQLNSMVYSVCGQSFLSGRVMERLLGLQKRPHEAVLPCHRRLDGDMIAIWRELYRSCERQNHSREKEYGHDRE